MKAEYLNKFIEVLLDYDYPVPDAIIYYVIKDEEFEIKLAAHELIRVGIMETDYDSSGHTTYFIPIRVRQYISKIPDEFEGDIYGYVLNQEQKKLEENEFTTNLMHEKLKLEVEDLRNRFFDYEIVKWRAKWGLIIAGIAAGTAIISLFV